MTLPNEQERLGLLIEDIFFPNHVKTCVSIVHNPGGIQGDNFSYCHEYAYFVYPRGGRFIGLQNREDSPDIRPLRDVSTGQHLREDAANCFYPIYVKDGQIVGFGDVCDDEYHPNGANVPEKDGVIAVYPIDAQGVERKWVFSRQSVEKIRDELTVEYNKKRKIWDIIRKKTAFNFKTVWSDKRYNANAYGAKLLGGILGQRIFTFPKSLYTVVDSVDAATQGSQQALVMDFFAGSGTTAHAVINLNRQDGGRRKYILVEMADYFETVLLPRIKKVVFCEKWKDGKPAVGEGISHFVKYYELEQYEDTLRKVKYDDSDLFENPYQDPYSQYVFLRDLKMLEALEVDLEQNKVKVDLSKTLSPLAKGGAGGGIDLAETLSNLTGKWIKRITPDPSTPFMAGFVEFEDGETVDLKNLDWRLIKPLIWW